MRTKALQKLDFILKIDDLTKKINREENRLWGRKEEIINKLNEEKNKVMKMEEDFLKGNTEQVENIQKELETDEFKDLEDTYVKIYALVDILTTSFMKQLLKKMKKMKEHGCYKINYYRLSYSISV